MNRAERAGHFKTFAALGLLVFGLSGCNSGEINCLTGQRSGVRNYPNVVEYQTVNFQGVPLTIENGIVEVGPNKNSRLNFTVYKLLWTIAFTATLQPAMNKLPAQDLNVEWQCVSQ